MQVMGIWRIRILPIILTMILLGASAVMGAENPTSGTGHNPKAVPAAPIPASTPVPAAASGQTCPPTPVVSSTPSTPKLHLRSFKIVGNKTISTKELESQLSEKLPGWWPPWGAPPQFRPQDLEYDVERLKNYYRDQGFYHTKIKPEVRCAAGGEVDITLVIHEGPSVKVTDISVDIKGGMDLAQLRDKWPLERGDRFTEKNYVDLKNLYLNYLPNHGHPKVRVNGRALVNPKKNTAKIHLTVIPGPLCYFGPINIKNEDKLETPAAAIREKVSFKSGQIFNLGELFNTQRQLYATDLFRSAVLTPEPVPAPETSIPIDIELAEKKKRSLKFGLGYGDEDKVRARLGLRYRNLGGGGRVMNLDASYSALGYLFTELFTNPAIFGSHFDFVNQSGARRRDLPGFTDRAYYTQSRIEHDIPWHFRVYFGHGLEYARWIL